MIDPAMNRGGLKDSENAPNSFFPKINRTVFWRLGADMDVSVNQTWVKQRKAKKCQLFFATMLDRPTQFTWWKSRYTCDSI